MLNGQNGLIADFVATFTSVRLSPQGHDVRSRLTSTFCGSLFDILRFSSDLCHSAWTVTVFVDSWRRVPP